MLALERVLEHEREIPQLFTTLCTLEIELDRHAADMMLAGHPPPMLIDGASVSALSQPRGAPPIGLGRRALAAGGAGTAQQIG